jgi:hypothetical protein
MALNPMLGSKPRLLGHLKLIVVVVTLSVFGWGCPKYIYKAWVPQLEAYDINPSAVNFPRVPTDQIIVYPEPKFAPKNYVLVARMKSAGDSYWIPQADLMMEFQKKAAELGADAVIVSELTQQGGGVHILIGGQPANDLSHAAAITLVTPVPYTGPPLDEYRGSAMAIRSKSQNE